MPVAYSYIRFSTPEQAKGDSLRRQIEASERYAEQHNLTLDRVLDLKDKGLSSFNSENATDGALGVFLKAIEVGIVKPGSYLLVESLDRLSRDKVTKALRLFTGIIESGITIVTLIDGQVYSQERIDEDRGTSLIISITIMARAHEESATKSKRLLEAWNKKLIDARAGTRKLTSKCPHWLTLAPDKTHFVVDEARSAVVKRIYQMVLDGYGTHTIEQIFNREEVPVFGRGDGWNRSYIIKILASRTVIGEFQHHTGKDRVQSGDPIKNYYPAVISDDTFYAVQRVRAAKAGVTRGRKGKLMANLLTGICRCGYCDRTMTYVNKGDL